MKYVTRKQCGLKPPRYRNTASLRAPSTGHWNGPTIFIGGKILWDHTKCALIVRGIQDFHMKPVSQGGRGWSDIAYNFVGCPHGYVFEGRGLNVINGANGTNVGNRTSHAIMVLAGTDNPFTDNEKVGFRECVRYVSDNTSAPDQAIGHRDHKSTECPGNDRYSWIHDGMPLPFAPQNKTKKEDQMEAALKLIKIHYKNARGRSYDVEVSDPGGYQHWVTSLLDAYDKGQPLKAVTDNLGGQLFFEMQNR